MASNYSSPRIRTQASVEQPALPLLRPYAPPNGQWSSRDAAHLLRRAALGAGPARQAAAVRAGLEATVEGLINAAAEQTDPKEQAEIEALGLLPLAQAFCCAQLLAADDSATGRARLRERLAWMWHGHFATSDHKVRDAVLMLRQMELFRRLGGGDFRILVRAVLRDPAMLIWLDGTLNTAGNPNENLARELMELFCLGRGNYSESDVQAAARGLSGWRVEGRRARLDAALFDAGDKQVLGKRGPLDTDGVADAVLAHPAAPRWLARRLIGTFVSDTPWPTLELELADEIVRQEFGLLKTLRVLLRSEAFFAPECRNQKIAAPLEFLARACLALGLAPAPADVARYAASAGQAPLLPPSVKGWDGGPAWAHRNAWLARGQCARELAGLARARDGEQPVELARRWIEALWPGEAAPQWQSALEQSLARSAPAEGPALIAETLLRAPEAHLI
jgi:uncharacterized protein (DUF1800 family)